MLKGYVEITKLKVEAHHGVMPQERIVGNMFEVSIGVFYDMEDAALTDNLSWAIDYSLLVRTVKEVMSEPSFLLENVALRMKHAIIDRFPKSLGGRLRIAKMHPPLPGQMEAASVALEW
jgi:dihydroneopterin aldolase